MEEVEAGARVLARGAAAADTRWPLLRRRSPPPLEPAATPCLDIVARHLDIIDGPWDFWTCGMATWPNCAACVRRAKRNISSTASRLRWAKP